MDAPHQLSTPFQGWLGTNYIPSSDEIFQIKWFLREPSNALAALQSQILQALDVLQNLLSKEARLKIEIEAHRSLCHPIRRLPDELLVEILSHTLPTDQFPVMSSKESPIVLTHVYQRWRKLVMTTPSFWSSIHIAVPPDWIEEGDLDNACVTVQTKRRAACLEWWLKNTGTSQPLAVSLYWPTTKVYPPEWYVTPVNNRSPIRSKDQRDEIPLLLMSHLHRISELVLQVPSEVSESLFGGLSKDDFPLLETLCLYVDIHYSSSEHMAMWGAPRLKKVLWTLADTSYLRFTYIFRKNWDSLQEISITHSQRLLDGLAIVSASPNLVQLSISVRETEEQDSTTVWTAAGPSLEICFRMRHIILPHLKTLCLIEAPRPNPNLDPSCAGHSRSASFLENLQAPVLENLSYQLSHNVLSTDFGDFHPLVPFLRSHTDVGSTPSLKRLMIGISSVSPASLVDILGIVPNLEQLRLFGETHYFDGDAWARSSGPQVVWNDSFLLGFTESTITITQPSPPPTDQSGAGKPMKSYNASERFELEF